MKQSTSQLWSTILGVSILVLGLGVLLLVFISPEKTWLLGILIGLAVLTFISFWRIERARHRALELSKDEFVSLVSHQLRTPLTSMRLLVEMLLDAQIGPLNDKQREYARMIEISTSRMIDLVSDFLNTSQLELGRLQIRPQPMHVEDIVAASVEQLQALASQQNLTLTFNKPQLPEVPVAANLYGQIVNNLLSNAMHYTPEGGTVTVALTQHAAGYQLDVSDTGIGIPASARPELFKRFYRADNAKHIIGEGSGLGLYLIKQIVDTCGGRVWYESTEGQGTTFHVIIPPTGMVATAAS